MMETALPAGCVLFTMLSTVSQAPPLAVENDLVRVAFDPSSGAIVEVVDRKSGLSLIDPAAPKVPFAIEYPERGWSVRYDSFDGETIGNGLRLKWRLPLGISVTADVTLAPDASEVEFRPKVSVEGNAIVNRLLYPCLVGLSPLAAEGTDELAHPAAGGIIIRDPVRWAQGLPGEGPRGLPGLLYPEGFSGVPIMLSSYAVPGVGGFMLAALDPSGTEKSLDFATAPGTDDLCWNVGHLSWDRRPGAGIALDYPVVLGVLRTGRWEEAAGRYREWVATSGAFTRGRLGERADVPEWLAGGVGYCTFGISAAHDQSAWLRALREGAGAPALHVLGHDWRQPPDAAWGADEEPTVEWAVSRWFPTRLDPANGRQIAEQGDALALFEFDTFANSARELDLFGVRPSAGFPYLCPAEEHTREFHADRDARAAEDTGADAMYGDISASNGPQGCYHPGHRHPPGDGRWLFDAYRSMFANTGGRMRDETGRVVPRGTEVIAEAVLPEVQFYQARAWGEPAASFEGERHVPLILSGRADVIPLFDYVYHEWGPVRMDGWLKLSREAGDLFYLVAARCALWGALPELNYEFSPLERWPQIQEEPSQLAYHFRFIQDPERTFDVDPDKLAFLREVAAARTGYGREFLALGRMLPMPAVECEPIRLSFWHYNTFNGRQGERRGEYTARSVAAQAWRAPSGDLALVLCNVSGETRRADVKWDLGDAGLAPGRHQAELIGPNGKIEDVSLSGSSLERTIDLPPRKVLLLRVAP